MVLDVVLNNVIVKLLKPSESFLMDEDVANLSEVNCLYQEMIHGDVVSEAQNIGFFSTARTKNRLRRPNPNSAILHGHGNGLCHPLYLAPQYGN